MTSLSVPGMGVYMNENMMNNSLDVAEQAIVGAWYQGDTIEQAQLWIALDIVKQARSASGDGARRAGSLTRPRSGVSIHRHKPAARGPETGSQAWGSFYLPLDRR